MISIENYAEQSVVYVTFGGRMSDYALKRACDEVWDITQSYEGRPHLTCSDVRELRPLTPSQESLLGATVRKTRLHDMRFCVHVVDPKSTRGIQLQRALEEAQVPDVQEVTVSSLSEAAEAIESARLRLGLPPAPLGRIAANMKEVHARMARLSRPGDLKGNR